MKCVREMNGTKESLKIKIKNKNVIAYFHVVPTNYNTSLIGQNVLLKKYGYPFIYTGLLIWLESLMLKNRLEMVLFYHLCNAFKYGS